MNKTLYKLPEFDSSAFNCPHCKAYSNMHWTNLRAIDLGRIVDYIKLAYCSHCDLYSIWLEEELIYPLKIEVDDPNEDLPEEIKDDYMESAKILNLSPRGSAALLRLPLQKLCFHLGEKGKELNEDIKSLVQKGLPSTIQRALDIVRVTGNEAVHPGQLDIKDNKETARQLFRLINFISEKMISEPKEIESIYQKLPENKLRQIEDRDKQ